MTTEKLSYEEIKNQQLELRECFFSFSEQQFAAGVKKANIEGKKLFSGGGGLYGTEEGLNELTLFLDKISEQIAKECDPQEVYRYEFNNHECSYTCDDTEAIQIVIGYFGSERAKQVKRRFANYEIPNE